MSKRIVWIGVLFPLLAGAVFVMLVGVSLAAGHPLKVGSAGVSDDKSFVACVSSSAQVAFVPAGQADSPQRNAQQARQGAETPADHGHNASGTELVRITSAAGNFPPTGSLEWIVRFNDVHQQMNVGAPGFTSTVTLTDLTYFVNDRTGVADLTIPGC